MLGKPLFCELSQGCILSPLLFIIHMKILGNNIVNILMISSYTTQLQAKKGDMVEMLVKGL